MHGIVIVWGFTGILGKLINMDSEPLVWWRMLIALSGLLLYMVLSKKKLGVPPKTMLYFLLTGLCVAAHWIFFFEAIKVSTVSVALATLSSTVFFTALIEPVVYKRKLQVYELVLAVGVIAGLGLIFGFETKYAWGIVFGLASAFLAAVFMVLNGIFIRENQSVTITFYEMIGGLLGICIYLGLAGIQTEQLFVVSLNDFIYLLILGLICTAFAFAVGVEIMKEISPFTVSISVNMEPVYSIILALFFFGEEEHMTWGFYLGAFIVVATIFINAWLKNKHKKKGGQVAALPSTGIRKISA